MKRKKSNENKADFNQIYESKGYRMVGRSDISNRLFSFLVDTIIMLAPIMIWNIIMMAVLGSIVSIAGIIIINIIIGILLIGTVLVLNAYIYTQTGGQSIGKRMFGYKVVKRNGKDVSKKQLVLREVIGFDIPFIVSMLFLNAIGVALFWGANTLILLLDKKQRTFIDFILRTNVVAVDIAKIPQSQECVAGTVEKIKVEQPCTFDLHIHSNFSVNGELNVEEIFQRAAKKHLKTISITDLDCAKSNSIAVRTSALYHVNYVPGIEINCQLNGTRLRVLGYFIDYNSELYATIENDSLMYEKNASIERVHKFERILGQRIDIDRLLSSNRFQKIPGELIAKHVLSRPEFQTCKILQPYIGKEQPDVAYRQLAKDYFSFGKPCYVVAKYPALEDVLDVVEMTGGVSILAYPGKLLANEPQIVDAAISKGVQGLEVFHPSHSKKEMASLLRYAMDHKLFITGGSGFYNHVNNMEIAKFTCPKDAEGIIEEFINAKQ